MATRDFVRTCINGQPLELRGSSVFAPVSDLIRRDLGLTGTKVVCAEGDCGSCTVLLGRAGNGSIRYRPVCSCILLGGQLDGCHVVTVEGLRRGNDLTPVQQAMVTCQGSQCGYCTPGFVVAMTALLDDGPVTETKLRRGLTGNLCRCTGYEPILRAGLAVDPATVTKLNDLYPAIEIDAGDAVRVTDGPFEFFKPTSVADACRFIIDYPGCTVLAGGTDVGVQLNKGTRAKATILSLAALPIRQRTTDNGRLTVGGGTSLFDLEAAVAAAIPEFGRYMDWFGSPPIRNAGTVGGNVATGSPIGDLLPPLLVLDAEIELTGINGVRSVPINRFYTGYRKSVAKPGELITAVTISIPPITDQIRFYKVSKRKDLDISTVSAAIRVSTGDGRIKTASVAMGGVGPTPARLPATEAALTGLPPTEATFDAAAIIAAGEVRPISDVRGSAGYRSRVAGNLIRKFYFDTIFGDDAAGRVEPGGNGDGVPSAFHRP
jgi:xanthine dehydrogenase small subunit